MIPHPPAGAAVLVMVFQHMEKLPAPSAGTCRAPVPLESAKCLQAGLLWGFSPLEKETLGFFLIFLFGMWPGMSLWPLASVPGSETSPQGGKHSRESLAGADSLP